MNTIYHNRVLAILMMMVAIPLSTLLGQNKYYVAPWGNSSNNGTTAKPWDLQTALSRTKEIKGGDFVLLESGTYGGQFRCQLSGSPGNPITIMPLRTDLNAEPVILDGGVGSFQDGAHTLQVLQGAKHLIIRDIHVTSSVVKRFTTTASEPEILRNSGFSVQGEDIKIVNCLAYDNLGNGIISSFDGINCEFYGNIIFNNGCITTGNNPRNHGIYLQNNSSVPKTIENNIIFNSYRMGVHGYSDSNPITNLRIIGNVVFNNGTMYVKGEGSRNIIVGGAQGNSTDIYLNNNWSYHVPGTTRDSGIQLGYTKTGKSFIAENNRSISSTIGFYFTGWTEMIFRNNKIVNESPRETNYVELVVPSGVSLSNYTFDNNEYYVAPPQQAFFEYSTPSASGKSNFEQWKSRTGFDRNSSETKSLPSKNWILLQPNKYENGRAHVTVCNFEKKTSETIDVSNIIPRGSEYVVYDVQNYPGPAIQQGTLTGSTITIPLNKTAIRKPFGSTWRTDFEHTPLGFNVFLIRSQSSGQRVRALSVNPATTLTTTVFTYESPSAQNVTLSVTDTNNTTVIAPRQLSAKAGTNTTTVDLTSLKPGSYYIVIQDAQTSDRIEVTRDKDPVPEAPIKITSCAPSPVTEVLTMIFTAPRQQVVTIELFTDKGVRLNSSTSEAQQGTNTITIDMREHPDGAYYVNVSNTASSDFCNFTKKQEPEIPFELLSCQPNPVDDLLLVAFNQPVAGNVAYQIKDATNAVRLSGTIRATKGRNEYQITVSTLVAGDYTTELTFNSQTINCSFTKNPVVTPPIQISSCTYDEKTQSLSITIISQIEQQLPLQFYDPDAKQILQPEVVFLKKGTTRHISLIKGLHPGNYYAVITDHNRYPYCMFTVPPVAPPPAPITMIDCPSGIIDQTITVVVNCPVASPAQVKVVSTSGSTLHSRSISLNAGNNTLETNVSALVDGTYVLSVDNDESSAVCELTISRKPDATIEIFSCKPSPTSEVLFINFYSPITGTINLTVRNALNQSVINQTINANEGTNDYRLNVYNLSKGLYTTTLSLGTDESRCEFEKTNPQPVTIQNCQYDDNAKTVLISYTSPRAQTVGIGLHTPTGQPVVAPSQTEARQGNNTFTLNVATVKAGQYLVTIDDGFTSVSCETIITEPEPPSNPVKITSCGPSPATNVLDVVYTAQLAGELNYKITNQGGAVLLQQTLNANAGSNTTAIDISGLDPGKYYFTLFSVNSQDLCEFTINRAPDLLLEIKRCTPRQTSDIIFTQFFSPRTENVTLRVINNRNTTVQTHTIAATEGLNDVQTDVTSLPAGTYFIQLNKGVTTVTCDFEKINIVNNEISIVNCPQEEVTDEVGMTIYSPSVQNVTVRIFDSSGAEVASPTQISVKIGNNIIGPIRISVLEGGTYRLVVQGENLIYCNFTKSVPEPTQTIELISCAPSVTSGTVEMRYTLLRASDVVMRIYDKTGAVFGEQQYKNVPPGEQTITVDLSSLAENQYYLALFDFQSNDFCGVILKEEGNTQLSMVNCTPKLVINSVAAEFLSPKIQTLLLTVKNEAGQQVHQQTIQAVEGYNQVIITVTNWQIGNYNLEISDNAQTKISCSFFKQNEEPVKPLEVLSCLVSNESTLNTSVYSPVRQNVEISIFALDGTLVMPTVGLTLNQGVNNRQVNISVLRQGVYYYVVSSSNAISYCKFSKGVDTDTPTLEIVSCSPNPTLDETFVNFYISEDGEVTLRIYTPDNRILEEHLINASAGQNRTSVNFEPYALGTYYVAILYKNAYTYCEIRYVDNIVPEDRISIQNCYPKLASDILYIEIYSPVDQQAVVRFRDVDDFLQPTEIKISLTAGTQRTALSLPTSMADGEYELIVSSQNSSDICSFTKMKGNGRFTLTLTSFYPNPSSGILNIDYYSFTEADVTVDVYENSASRLIHEKIKTHIGLNSTQLDLSSLNPGIYIISLSQGEERASFKQIIIPR